MKKILILITLLQFLFSQSVFYTGSVNRSFVNYDKLNNDQSFQDTFFGDGYSIGIGIEYNQFTVELNFVKVRSTMVYRHLPTWQSQINQNGTFWELPLYYRFNFTEKIARIYGLTGINLILNGSKYSTEIGDDLGMKERMINREYIKSNTENSLLFGIGILLNNNFGFQIRYLPDVYKSKIYDNGYMKTGLTQIKIEYHLPEFN